MDQHTRTRFRSHRLEAVFVAFALTATLGACADESSPGQRFVDPIRADAAPERPAVDQPEGKGDKADASPSTGPVASDASGLPSPPDAGLNGAGGSSPPVDGASPDVD